MKLYSTTLETAWGVPPKHIVCRAICSASYDEGAARWQSIDEHDADGFSPVIDVLHRKVTPPDAFLNTEQRISSRGDGNKKSTQGTSFTTKKDEALIKAWSKISEDAIIGSAQKSDAFYKAINKF